MKRLKSSNTYKKESNDNVAAARTYPRVSLGMLQGVGKRYTFLKGVTRSRHHVGVETKGISPDLQKITP
jgi:hypothetical protein